MYFNCCELLIFVTFVTITTHMISCHLMAAKINLDQDGNFDMDDLSASEALRARGYLAKEFRFYTRDGYKLHLVRGRNPLIKQTYEIKRKNPILFIHGAFAGPGCFVYHSAKVKPKDFSKLDTNDEAVIEALKFEPSAKALPFLAMNFGHDIWLLARRGIAGSNDYKAGHLNRTIEEILTSIPVATLNTIIKTRPQIKRIRTQPKTETKRPQKRQQDDIIKQAFNLLNETTQLNWNKFNDLVKYNRYTLAHEFDADYWRFTYDEQADYDVPETIDFILSQSSYGVKVGLVGWSAGGLTILMSLSIYPRQLEHKVASVVLWSPALNLGTASDMVRELGILKPLIEPNYKAPLPPVFAVKPIKALVRSFCKIDIIQKTICNPIIEAVLGPVDKYSQYVSKFCKSKRDKSESLANITNSLSSQPETICQFDRARGNWRSGTIAACTKSGYVLYKKIQVRFERVQSKTIRVRRAAIV